MYRQSEKYFLNSNISSRCPHNMVNIGPLTAEIGWGSLGHHSKFQRVLRLRFVTAPTSHNGGQQNFARCSAVAWAATTYNYYTLLGLLPLTEFCQVQNSVCIQVLHYPILAALLHGTRAVGVSQILRRGIFTRQGGHHVRHWVVELSSLCLFCVVAYSFDW